MTGPHALRWRSRLRGAVALLALAGVAGWAWAIESDGAVLRLALLQAAAHGHPPEAIKGWALKPGRFEAACAVDLYFAAPGRGPEPEEVRGALVCFARPAALWPWRFASYNELPFRMGPAERARFRPLP